MNTLRMKLVFRLGEVGFSIAIEETVQILEVLPGWLNRENADPRRFLLGEMIYRGAMVPVHDLRRRMQLSLENSKKDAAVLILGTDGDCFALTVDQINGIFPDAEFATYPVPFQFVDGGAPAYERVDIWREEPLLALDVQTLAVCWDT